MSAIALSGEAESMRRGAFGDALARLVAALRAKPAAAIAVALVLAIELLGAALETEARRALQIFALALIGWTWTRLDDAFVALAAALAMAVVVLDEPDEMFDALGNKLIWLLIASFMLAAAFQAAGLADRLAHVAISRARTTRGAFHALTAAMIATAFLVPSTSGRAALMAPVYEAVARPAGAELRKGFALLFPTIILLSAIASLTGAGAHVLAAELLDEVSDAEIGFLQWALYGLPFAAVSSFLATEIVLRLFVPRADHAASFTPPAKPIGDMRKAVPLIAIGFAVIVGWATKPLHGLEDTLIALIGACAAVAPALGGIGFKRAVEAVEWRLVLFMAATVVIAEGLTDSGLVKALSEGALRPLGELGAPPMVWLLAIAALGLVAHLLIQSRTARIAILLPPTLAAAQAANVDPLAAAFTLVAATGFCQLLMVSAKPVALFGALPGRPFGQADLARLGAVLMPMLFVLIALFAAVVWPLLGLSTSAV